MAQDSLPAGRRRLASVLRLSTDVISTDDVVATLSVKRTEASKLLSRWADQGWLRRVGRGAYVAVPLDSLQSTHVLSDPWVLVPALYAQAYIGGRTAAEHWDLTEQIFRDIVVMTTQPVRKSHEERHGAQFTLHHIPPCNIFGTKTIWRGASKVLISDVHRTLVDMLNNPAIGGGIYHVADCFKAYLKRPDRKDQLLIEYGDRIRNGAVFKRLGFLAEQDSSAPELVKKCLARLTQGNAKIDSSLNCTRLVSKWHLWIPKTWSASTPS